MSLTVQDMQRLSDDLLDRMDQRFEDNQRYVDAKHDENRRDRAADRLVLDSILIEQKKTNGRVTRLEQLIAAVKGGITLAQLTIWIAIVTGTYIVLTVAMGFHK